MRALRTLLPAALVALLAVAPAATAATSPAPAGPLRMRAAGPPTVTAATDGRRHLVMELIVANAAPRPLRLDRLSLRGVRTGRLATLRGAALARVLIRDDGTPGSAGLPAGAGAVALLDVTLPRRARAPRAVLARVAATGPDGGALTATGVVRVDRRPPLRIRPPLRGDGLLIAGCCGPPFSHRGAAEIRHGTKDDVVFGQRYAIDALRLTGDGLATWTGDPARNESYAIHDAAVVAVAPGRIVAVRDGLPENTPGQVAPGLGADDRGGNRVVQRLGKGRYALYAHMRPGSITVAPGDRVRPGQVIGRVGNSGNSSEPHLHFHVMDGPGGPSGVAAEGLPYVLSRMRLTARVEGLDALPPAPALRPVDPPLTVRGRYPLTGDVIALP